MPRPTHLITLAAFGALAAAIIALLAFNLTQISGSHESQNQGDEIRAFASGRWTIDEHGDTRFILTALRPVDLRCLSDHPVDAEAECDFEREIVLDTPAPWTFSPMRHHPSHSNRPSFENGLLWAVVEHMLAPTGAPVECTSEEGNVVGHTRSVPSGGTVWCKVQFRPSAEEPQLVISVGNASIEVHAP